MVPSSFFCVSVPHLPSDFFPYFLSLFYILCSSAWCRIVNGLLDGVGYSVYVVVFVPFYSWFTLPFSPLVNMRIIASPDKMSPLNSDAKTLVLFSLDLYTPLHVVHTLACSTCRIHHLESFSYVGLWMCVCNFGGMFSHREIEWVLLFVQGGLVKTHTSRIITRLVFRLSRLIERMTCSSIKDMLFNYLPMHISSFLKVFFIWTTVFFFSNDACVAPSQKHVCLSIRNTVMQQRMHNHGDHEEHFYSITILCVVLRAIV